MTSTRVECPHAEHCPGCPAIELSPDAQLAAKAARLARALAVYPALAALAPEPVRPAVGGVAYRTRAKLVVAPGSRLGLYARGGAHEVIDLPGCRVLAPVVAEAASALRRLLARPPAAAGAVLQADGEGIGCLRAVDLREVRDEDTSRVLVALVLRAPPEPEAAALSAAADALERELPGLAGVAVSLHSGRGPQLLGRPPRVIRGEPLQRDRLARSTPFTWVSHGAFAQAHRGQAAAIQTEVAACLDAAPGLRALEVYAGSGGLGLALAAAGARVTSIESFEPAVVAARQAADEQGLKEQIEAHAGPAEEWLPRLRADAERFAAAVVNPPRRGLPGRVREGLTTLLDVGSHTGSTRSARARLVYVSCAPETLARDLAHLAWLGLRVTRIVPFDLMPQTLEVECVVQLEQAAPPAPVVLHEDELWLAVDKPPGLPTVPHPEAPISLLERVRALPGGSETVPLHRLDAGTSGVCLFARSADAAGSLARAFARPDSAKTYLALVRGVARASGRIDRALRTAGRMQRAVTRHRRHAVLAGHALLEVQPETGRTHQIRRHLASIGEPVLGDERYGHAPSNRHLFERHGLDRPFLHCSAIEWTPPRHAAAIRIVSPLAADLAAVITSLGGDPLELGAGSAA